MPGRTDGFAPESREGTGFRIDIEGLRAVAVGLVILDHLAGWPGGGFVGVDVFFVISGFLITGLLLDETRRRGRLSIRGFYARRARRILPAALAMLAAVVGAAHLAFRADRVRQTVTDVKWALGFSENIHQARIGTDYFSANRPPSLVQHFWSLAVEEQFYLVWPLVMLIVLALARRRAQRLTLLLGVVAAATAASFLLALRETSHAPTAAYFSSPDRAWELGTGALVAVAAAAFPGLATRWPNARGPLWLLGLAGIVVSGFVVSAGPGFPAPWAALPVGSAALLIAAGIGGPVGSWGVALTNRLSRYVGRISYSLYLWHWPVILVAAALVPHPWPMKYSIAVFAMLGLSIASYHFVEAPMRRLRFNRRPRARRKRIAVRRPALAVLGCLAVVVVLSVLVPGQPPPSFATAAADAPPGLATSQPYVAQPDRPLTTAINQALKARSFPDLTPSVDQVGSARSHWGSCDGATDISKCRFGSSAPNAPVAVVIGDSVAMSWLPGIEGALADGGWRLYGLTLEACPAADLPVRDVHGVHDGDCDQRHEWVKAQLARLDPRLVILASTDDTLGRMDDHSTGAQASAEYRAALQRTIQMLRPGPNRHVLTLAPPPLATDLAKCDTAGSTPADCVRRISNRWILFAQAERAAAVATHTSYSDTHLWFCNRAGYCPAFIGSMLVRWDGQHVTDVYARTLVDDIRAVVDRATRNPRG